MSIDHIEILRTGLPNLFDVRDVPDEPGWGIVPVPDPDYVQAQPPGSERDPDALDTFLTLEQELALFGETRYRNEREWPEVTHPRGLTLEEPDQAWPGAPRDPGGSTAQAPDVLAFYLPFHHYHPKWWGIYLLAEGVVWLACYLMYHMPKAQQSPLVVSNAVLAARLFLYYHEAFHHRTECFATRLELADRMPLYIRGFTTLYRSGCSSGYCPEETVANATGIRETREKLRGVTVATALESYVQSCPPPWHRGTHCLGDGPFRHERSRFAEACHRACFPTRSRLNPDAWLASPHHFHGIANVRSPVNYLIPRKSSIANRVRLIPWP